MYLIFVNSWVTIDGFYNSLNKFRPELLPPSVPSEKVIACQGKYL